MEIVPAAEPVLAAGGAPLPLWVELPWSSSLPLPTTVGSQPCESHYRPKSWLALARASFALPSFLPLLAALLTFVVPKHILIQSREPPSVHPPSRTFRSTASSLSLSFFSDTHHDTSLRWQISTSLPLLPWGARLILHHPYQIEVCLGRAATSHTPYANMY